MEVDGLIARASGAVSKDSANVSVEELFDRLLNENGAALHRLAGAFTETAADRDDLFQEMVLAIWQALPNFRGESSARTYLFRIAHNRATAFLVRRRIVPMKPDEELLLADPRPNPEKQIGAQQERRQLLSAVRRLPLVYRDVIALALEGLSYREIAEVLGVSETNVGVRMNRARAGLRKLLGKNL